MTSDGQAGLMIRAQKFVLGLTLRHVTLFWCAPNQVPKIRGVSAPSLVSVQVDFGVYTETLQAKRQLQFVVVDDSYDAVKIPGEPWSKILENRSRADIVKVSQDSTLTVPDIVLSSQSYLPTRGSGTNRLGGLLVHMYGSFCPYHRLKELAALDHHENQPLLMVVL